MEAYELFGDLLDYPNPAVLHGFDSKISGIAHAHPKAASLLVEFHSAVLRLTPGKIEEIYTNAFDLRAESSLYVGHHLFGEDFKRSVLMSRLKNWYKSKDFSTGTEMPDHLSVVLRFLGRNQDDPDTQEFITECLAPAVTRIIAGLQESAGPYTPALHALLLILQSSHVASVTQGVSE